MYRIIAIFVILIFNQTSGLAQNYIPTKNIDFKSFSGDITKPYTLKVQNNSSEPMVFLKHTASPSVMVKYTKGYIQPGQTGNIYISYRPKHIGSFKEKLLIYTNLKNTPDTLLLFGKSTNTSSCPNFKDRGKLNKYERDIYIIDSITKSPIEKAKVRILYNFKQKAEFKVNKNGQTREIMPPGNYRFKVEAPNYNSFEVEFYMPKTYPLLLFELSPIEIIETETEAIAKQEETEITDTDTIIEKIEDSPKEELIVKTKDSALLGNEFKQNNVVFLLDISFSMNKKGKIDSLKTAMNILLSALRKKDVVSILSFNDKVFVNCEGVSGENKKHLNAIVDLLICKGLTYGVQGLKKAYEIADNNFIEGGNNQIILATDGRFTGKEYSALKVNRLIFKYLRKGIKISVVGFDFTEQADPESEKIAKRGKGNYIHFNMNKPNKELLLEEIKRMSKK